MTTPAGIIGIPARLGLESVATIDWNAWPHSSESAFKAQPMTLCAYDVDCDDVLDLTDPATRSAARISSADLACPWKDLSTRGEIPPSWALADSLIAKGCAGIVVPSFASGATTTIDANIVFWNWSPEFPHQVRVIDDFGRLPHTTASWAS